MVTSHFLAYSSGVTGVTAFMSIHEKIPNLMGRRKTGYTGYTRMVARDS